MSVPPSSAQADRPVLITGGAGFIGSNLADRLAREGRQVLLLDNLSRPGVEGNLRWLTENHGERIIPVIADIRDRQAVREAVREVAEVYHFAAQVAVTTSVASPEEDFEINARGTLNLLEALRAQPSPPSLVFTSTNKVYGPLEGLAFTERERDFAPQDEGVRRSGIGENHPLDFYSPYGCSKGAADQYVLDYARIYNLPLTVFRMSCIYGPRQFGTEDQGWVAHFLIRALEGKPVALYGNGKQVRDVLFVEDLLEAFLLAQRHMDGVRAKAFNIGGGTNNAICLLDMLSALEDLLGHPIERSFGSWRPGDQVYYVSDTARFRQVSGWQARTGIETGLDRLLQWLRLHRSGEPDAGATENATYEICPG